MKNKPSYRRIYRIMVDIFRIGSLQSIITLSFAAVMTIAMIIIGLIFFGTFSDNAEKNAAESSRQILNQASLNLEYYLDSMINISDLIAVSMEDFAAGRTEELSGKLRYTLDTRDDIESIVIFSYEGQVLMAEPDYKFNAAIPVNEQEWFLLAAANPYDNNFQEPHVQRFYENRRPWVVTLSRGFNVESTQRTYVIVVDMNFSVIEDVCSQVELGRRGYIYVVDKAGNIIYHPQQQLIYAGLKEENIQKALSSVENSYVERQNGEEISTVIVDVDHADWKMVGISYVDEIIQNRKNFNSLILIILLVGILFIVIASIFISYKISQPIKRLEYQMNKVERGDFNIDPLKAEGEDEVRQLTHSFNLMIQRIKQLMGQIIEEQEAKRKNELKALQAQINPHFLYNTLDSIIWMNENKNHEGVSEMTAALAKLFRISISRGREIITVRDEIDHVISYLVIQKIRYKNKFEYSVDLPDEYGGCPTLKLLLQPIVENSIYHGINSIPDKGLIEIKVYVEGSTLVYLVSDNGYGIEMEKLSAIMEGETKSKHSTGVGIKNVNERIKLYYGDEYGISIESEPEEGTNVYIRIPYVEE
ncbi:MAG: sensor histidine kinase [Clostridia bacterium]|nr:sensor histidine kinase [Clostridia bacterium]